MRLIATAAQLLCAATASTLVLASEPPEGGSGAVQPVSRELDAPESRDATRPLNIGQPAPLLRAKAWLNGEPLKEYVHGKVYILHAWAMRQKAAQQMQRRLNELAREHKDQAVFIGLNVDDSIDAVKRAMSGPLSVWRLNYLQAIDCENPGDARTFSGQWLAEYPYVPWVFVIDQEGRLAWTGHPADLKEPLEQIIAGRYDIKAAAEAQRLEREVTARAVNQDSQQKQPPANPSGVPRAIVAEYLAAKAEYEAEGARVDAQMAYYNQFASQFPIDGPPGAAPTVPEMDRRILYRFERARQAYEAALGAAQRR